MMQNDLTMHPERTDLNEDKRKKMLQNAGKFLSNDPNIFPNLLNQFRTLNPSKFQAQLQLELGNPLQGYLDNAELNQMLSIYSTTAAANLVRNSPHRVSPSPPAHLLNDLTMNEESRSSMSNIQQQYNDTFSTAVHDKIL